MTCKQCKFYRDGACTVPLWTKGELITSTVHSEDDTACTMFEEGSDAVSG